MRRIARERRGRALLASVLLALGLLVAAGLAAWAVVESREAPAHHLPRFQALVAAPGPEPVRVLFYGQSITRQDWWQGVARYLSRRFPERRFEFHNLAVGGHDASRLVRLVAADVLPLQPDLVIFHVYGEPADVRRTLQQIRTGTSADVLLANDHIVRDAERFEETSDLKLVESGLLRRLLALTGLIGANSDWHAWRNQEFLPDLAHELAIAVADVRQGWARELGDSGRPASDYLADDIHLNARGVALMEKRVIESLERHLQVAVQGQPPQAQAVTREITVGPSCEAPVAVSGYRVDLIGPAGLALKVQVDGREAARHPDLIAIGRASELPGTSFPALLRVGRSTAADAAPVRTGRHVLSLGPRDAQGHYAVSWRVQGDEGRVQGTTGEALRWDAAGLVIEPQDWNLAYAEQVFGATSFSGAEVSFEVSAPPPVLRLEGSSAVMAVRFPADTSYSLCLRTEDGRTERVRLIERHAAYRCEAPSGHCQPTVRP